MQRGDRGSKFCNVRMLWSYDRHVGIFPLKKNYPIRNLYFVDVLYWSDIIIVKSVLPLRKFLCKGINFSFYLLSRFSSRYIKNETIHWKPNKCLIYDVITISRHSEDHYILINDDLSNIILAKIKKHFILTGGKSDLIS